MSVHIPEPDNPSSTPNSRQATESDTESGELSTSTATSTTEEQLDDSVTTTGCTEHLSIKLLPHVDMVNNIKHAAHFDVAMEVMRQTSGCIRSRWGISLHDKTQMEWIIGIYSSLCLFLLFHELYRPLLSVYLLPRMFLSSLARHTPACFVRV